MSLGLPSNVKTFWSVLAAVLVAAAVITAFKSCVEDSSRWETTKNDLVRELRVADEEFDTILAKPLSSMSLDELHEVGPRLKQLRTLRTDGYSTLARLLQRKPFFPLNAEEGQLLRAAKMESGQPVDTEATSPLPVPKFVVVTYPTEFYNPDGSSVPIPNGTRLKVIGRPKWTELSVEYQGRTYSIQTALTQPSE